MFAALCLRAHPLKHSLAESIFVSRVRKTAEKIFVSRGITVVAMNASNHIQITVYVESSGLNN